LVAVGWKAVRALLLAAAFSHEQLESLCQTVFGASLKGITKSEDPQAQADAIVEFAQQYGLIRELTDMILHNAANRPAVQNLLLSDDMSLEDGKNSNASMDMVRLEHKVERLADKLDALAAIVAVMQHSREPLNWNIIVIGIIVSFVAGALVWLMVAAR
jgi:hypothetical protein